MKIKVNCQAIIIFLLIMLDLNMFYLVDEYRYMSIGISFYDIVVIIKIGIFLWSCVKYNLYHSGRLSLKYFNNKIIIVAFIMIILSSVIATFTYDQSFLSGIIAQRKWISSLLMVVPVSIWMDRSIINERQLKKSLFVACGIYLFLCILQYIFINIITFMHLPIVAERYGTTRLRFECVFNVLVLGFLTDDAVMNKKMKEKVFPILLIVGSFILLAIVTKGRMATLSCAAAMCICLVLRRTSVVKKSIIIIAIIIVVSVLMSTTIGQDTMNIIWGGNSSLSADTLTIREYERMYYMGLLTQNPLTFLLGYGFANQTISSVGAIASPTIGSWIYYTSDIGVMGNMFYYGLFGLCWWVYVVIYLVRRGLRIYKMTGRTAFLQLIISELVGSLTLIPLIFNNSIAFIILLVWTENVYQKNVAYKLNNQTS